MAFPTFTTRYLLYLLNLVFLVSALVVGVAALLVEFSFRENFNKLFIEEYISSPPIIIAIACGVICLVSLFGCCGVIKESRCILISFSVLLFIIFIVEVGAGVYIYQISDKISSSILNKMEESMKEYEYEKTNHSVVTRSWDVLQHDFRCCGIKNSSEWKPIIKKGDIIPSSCCTNLPTTMKCTPENAYSEGCYTVFETFVSSKACLLAAIAIGVGVAQLLCSIASCLLARHISREYQAV